MMLGNTGAFFAAQRRVPSAKDYPSLPDIFFFDGIENAGFGSHDANAATWKNLVEGSNDLTITGGYSWLDNAIRFDGTGGAKKDAWRTSPSTVEFLFQPERTTTTTTSEVLYSTGDSLMFGAKSAGGDKIVFNAGSGAEVDLSDFSRPVAVAYTANQPYINGVSTVNSSGAEYNYMGTRVQIARRYTGNALYFQGRVFAYRAHSRVLTADEVAANYAVDKARFGLA